MKVHERSKKVIRAFEIFQGTAGTATMHGINAVLRSEGYEEISKRSYTHLLRLRKYGVTKYMTINAFDQWRKREYPKPVREGKEDQTSVRERIASQMRKHAKIWRLTPTLTQALLDIVMGTK